MNEQQNIQKPLNAPITGATAAAPNGQLADSVTARKQPADTTEAQSPSQGMAPGPTQGDAPVPAPAETPPVKQDAHSLKQAAQSEHKPSTDGVSAPSGSVDCAHAGGRRPQSPVLISKSKSAKKSLPKQRDNHVSIRLTDDEFDVVEKLMSHTGMTLSEAIRTIINAFLSISGSVYLCPKSPPEHLEKLLGELSKWRKEFGKARPRLNMPTPVNDEGRYAEVIKWRKESDRLLKAIPQLETLVSLALGVMTSLTPERVIHIHRGYTTLETWKTIREKEGKLALVPFLEALMDLLVDAGIKPPQKK